FQTLDIPFLKGQTCRMRPGTDEPFDAIVNKAFVERYYPSRALLDRTMTLVSPQNGRTMKIVGIVEDVREEGYGHASQPLVYTCGYLRFWPDSEFLLRTQADPITMVGAIRETIRKQELTRATYAVQTLNDALANTL